jgi:hypothetical protein
MIRVIFFCDPINDDFDNLDSIKNEFEKMAITFNSFSFKQVELPPNVQDYDILLFDGGGSSMGNSFMWDYCNDIIDMARDNPSKIFIMQSAFTSQAMQDCLDSLNREIDPKPINIFLTIQDAKQQIESL